MPMDEIEELKNNFVKDLLPMKVYLFGSFAEGRANEDSDYDFYIYSGEEFGKRYA